MTQVSSNCVELYRGSCETELRSPMGIEAGRVSRSSTANGLVSCADERSLFQVVVCCEKFGAA